MDRVRGTVSGMAHHHAHRTLRHPSFGEVGSLLTNSEGGTAYATADAAGTRLDEDEQSWDPDAEGVPADTTVQRQVREGCDCDRGEQELAAG